MCCQSVDSVRDSSHLEENEVGVEEVVSCSYGTRNNNVRITDCYDLNICDCVLLGNLNLLAILCSNLLLIVLFLRILTVVLQSVTSVP